MSCSLGSDNFFFCQDFKKKLHLLLEFVQTTLQYSGLMQEGHSR